MTSSEDFLRSQFPIINAELMQKGIESAKAAHSAGGAPSSIKSNTTVFALKYKSGVILSGDRRSSDGNYGIYSDANNKVVQLTKYTGLACAGYCNVISFIENNMTAVCQNFERLYGQQLSPDGQANYLKILLEQWWFFFVANWYWGIGIPVMGAYDKELGPRIITFDHDGYYSEPQFFGGAGCGFEAIKGLVYALWRENMSRGQAIELATQAMIVSGATSHGVSDARLVLPTMAVIDNAGFKWVPQTVLKEKRDMLVKKMGGLQCLLKG